MTRATASGGCSKRWARRLLVAIVRRMQEMWHLLVEPPLGGRVSRARCSPELGKRGLRNAMRVKILPEAVLSNASLVVDEDEDGTIVRFRRIFPGYIQGAVG